MLTVSTQITDHHSVALYPFFGVKNQDVCTCSVAPDSAHISCMTGGFFIHLVTWEAQESRYWRLNGGPSSKGHACQCRRHKRCKFDPWVAKIPWRRAWQPTPVFLPEEEPGRLQSIGSQTVRHDWNDFVHTVWNLQIMQWIRTSSSLKVFT